ncbi:extensin [Drosophila grimshawi]|uniref:extensin n=1 Tax=Drosophila grimshawi TaxID=7222 RepID=UPI0013EF1652|nr:extensin [Drosophila grimshawi]
MHAFNTPNLVILKGYNITDAGPQNNALLSYFLVSCLLALAAADVSHLPLEQLEQHSENEHGYGYDYPKPVVPFVIEATTTPPPTPAPTYLPPPKPVPTYLPPVIITTTTTTTTPAPTPAPTYLPPVIVPEPQPGYHYDPPSEPFHF